MKRSKYTDKQKQDALEAVSKGMSVREVFAISDVKLCTLYRWLKEAKIGLHYKCVDCGLEFDKSILYAQHRSTAHPHKTVTWPLTVNAPSIPSKEELEKFDHSHRMEAPWKANASVNPEAIEEERVGRYCAAYLKEHPVKISTDDFMNMLRNLISENTQTKEELARLRRSLGEWQQRAGRIMEQAQELAQKK